MAAGARSDILIRPITLTRIADFQALMKTNSITASCVDIFPRRTNVDGAARHAYWRGKGVTAGEGNRRDAAAIITKGKPFGLLAYDGREPVGFLSAGPRTAYPRVDESKVTPRIDELPVWVVPCLYVKRTHRGRAGRRGLPTIGRRAPRGKRVGLVWYGGAVQARRLPQGPWRAEGPAARLGAARHHEGDMPAVRAPKVEIRPLTPARADDVRTITRGTWGTQCWDLWFRFTDEQKRDLFGGSASKDEKVERKRAILAKLARRRHAPVLVAYADGEPLGFVSLGPRTDYPDVERSRSMPPVDDVPVWVIPCMTVRKQYRGRGVALALLCAAIDYARAKGAPAIEGYPRKDGKRMSDATVVMGTESLFRKAGFRKIRDLLPKPPPGSAPRVTMRATCAPLKKTSSASRTRSRAAS